MDSLSGNIYPVQNQEYRGASSLHDLDQYLHTQDTIQIPPHIMAMLSMLRRAMLSNRNRMSMGTPHIDGPVDLTGYRIRQEI